MKITNLGVFSEDICLVSPEYSRKLQTLDVELALSDLISGDSDRSGVIIRGNIAIIPVLGVLDTTFHFPGFSTSYPFISNAVSRLNPKTTPNVVFYFNTVGGTQTRLYSTAKAIFDLKSNGFTTYAFVEDLAASAGYVLASSANKIIGTSTSLVGSIAAVRTFRAENTEEYITLTSKPNKIFNPENSEHIEKQYADLAYFDKLLNETVSTNRPQLSIQDIIDTKGDVFTANDAVRLNLLDEISPSFEDFLATLEETDMPESQASAEVLQLQAEITELKAQITALTAKHTQSEEAASNYKDYITSLLKTSAAYNLSTTVVDKYTGVNMSAEMLQIVLKLEAEKVNPGINSFTPDTANSQGKQLPVNLSEEEKEVNALLNFAMGSK